MPITVAPAIPAADFAALASAIDAALPQTQCTRCGYPDCRAYADAVAVGDAGINQCPPGGVEGIVRLAEITGRAVLPLNPANGVEAPLRLALIDEAWCIGCTLCIKACPVDCIVGAPKRMHTVVASLCTGCELCIPACPVDCIALVNMSGTRTGWDAWSAQQADDARDRYGFHRERTERDKRDNEARLAAKAQSKLADLTQASAITDRAVLDSKRSVIEAAMARARSRAQATPDKT